MYPTRPNAIPKASDEAYQSATTTLERYALTLPAPEADRLLDRLETRIDRLISIIEHIERRRDGATPTGPEAA